MDGWMGGATGTRRYIRPSSSAQMTHFLLAHLAAAAASSSRHWHRNIFLTAESDHDARTSAAAERGDSLAGARGARRG